jgi:hypothetical protein
MEREDRQTEVTYKFYLPDNAEDLKMFSMSTEYYLALHRIHDECRKVWKYEDASEEKDTFARMIGEIAGEFVVLMTILCLISPLESKDYPNKDLDSYENFLKYVEDLDSEQDLDEVIRILFFLRQSLVDAGYKCPPVSQILMETRKELEDRDTFISNDDFAILMMKIKKYESLSIGA